MGNLEIEIKLKKRFMAIYFIGMSKVQKKGTNQTEGDEPCIDTEQENKYRRMVEKVTQKIDNWYENSVADKEAFLENDEDFYNEDKSPNLFSSFSEADQVIDQSTQEEKTMSKIENKLL